jgi:hypothetical protein
MVLSMFRKIPALISSLFLILLVFPLLCNAGPSRKPLPPLQVRIAPVQPGVTSDQLKPGDTVEFRVTAVSFIDVREMRIEVELLDGAELISGDTLWRGPASKNEEKTIVLTVRVPAKGKGRITARVMIPPTDSTRFSSETQYVLGPEIKSKPEHERPVKKDSKGRDIIEYR